ncbi:MAG: hypothetical protein Kow0092_31690 [Deferrisomatales bacterium]
MGGRVGALWRAAERWIEGINRAAGFVGALCLLAAALIVTEGVVIRKVLGWSTTWQIELSVFLLMYACFVGAAYAQTREGHLNVDLILVYFSPRARERLLLAAAVCGCALCAVIAAYSWPMWWEAWIRDEHSESLWGPPLWIPHLFLPLGMTLLFLQYLVTIARKVRQLREGTFETEAVRAELREIELPGAGGPAPDRREGEGRHG